MCLRSCFVYIENVNQLEDIIIQIETGESLEETNFHCPASVVYSRFDRVSCKQIHFYRRMETAASAHLQSSKYFSIDDWRRRLVGNGKREWASSHWPWITKMNCPATMKLATNVVSLNCPMFSIMAPAKWIMASVVNVHSSNVISGQRINVAMERVAFARLCSACYFHSSSSSCHPCPSVRLTRSTSKQVGVIWFRALKLTLFDDEVFRCPFGRCYHT